MKSQLLRKLLAAVLVAAAVLGISHRPTSTRAVVEAQSSSPTVIGTEGLLPDDIMPAAGESGQDAATVTDYTVMPILFVPADSLPNPFALDFIDRRMQAIQRWYGEQLIDRTFTLEPAHVVTGTHPLSYYYDGCYPPTPSCEWGYTLWYSIFADLDALGYSWRSDRILGVFFQHDGVGGTALGGGNRFLVGLQANNVLADCTSPGCAAMVDEGGVAHELGHALGLPHPEADPQDSPGKSVMGYGFYAFPKATFVDTPTNPERTHLYASPFLNNFTSLRNGGFEDCGAHWNLSAGGVFCATYGHRSGLSALVLLNSGQAYQVDQVVVAAAGQTYDFSGWLRIVGQTGNFDLQVQVIALSPSGSALSTFTVGRYSAETGDWERLGASVRMPYGTSHARIQIATPAMRATTYLDDLSFEPAQHVPQTQAPVSFNNGDAVPSRRPTLLWTDSTAATSYQIQIATDGLFDSPIFDATVWSPWYTVPSDLAYGTHYFWRVRAINGAGGSDWSRPWRFIPRPPGEFYNDEFETGVLSNAWSWVREDWTHWYFGGPLNRRGYGYLGITTQTGDLQGGNNAKNLLLRDAPPGDFEASTTVDFWEPLNADYQQGGLLVYQDDDNYIKIARIHDGGLMLEMQAEVGGTVVISDSIPNAEAMPIKITRIGNTYSTHYSSDGLNWRTLGQPITVSWPDPKMGLGAYSAIPTGEVTAYFDWFRVTEPCFHLTAGTYPRGGGTVTATPGTCDGGLGYRPGTEVTVTVSAGEWFSFNSWSGDAGGAESAVTITLTSDKIIVANLDFLGEERVFMPLIVHNY